MVLCVVQILALFAMECPVSLDAEDIRNEKVKLLRNMKAINLEDVVVGQYRGATLPGGDSLPGVLGCLAEPTLETSISNQSVHLLHGGCLQQQPGAAEQCGDGACTPHAVISCIIMHGAPSGCLGAGYLDDETVPKGSTTETFAAVACFINNARWDGVPFLLKAGKALQKRSAQIRVQVWMHDSSKAWLSSHMPTLTASSTILSAHCCLTPSAGLSAVDCL